MSIHKEPDEPAFKGEIKTPDDAPLCPSCGKRTFMRTYERPVDETLAKAWDSKPTPRRITEFRCSPCDLNLDPTTLIPLCDYCKVPLKDVFEIRTEITTDSYKLKTGEFKGPKGDGRRFEYDGGDVDDNDDETICGKCNEYPGDAAIEWFNERKVEASE